MTTTEHRAATLASRLTRFRECVDAIPDVAARLAQGQQFNTYESALNDEDAADVDCTMYLSIGSIDDRRSIVTVEGRAEADMIAHALTFASLASVSSASADWTRTKAFDEAAAECMRAAEVSTFADTVSEDERNGHRSACNLLAMNFRVMASRAAPEWLTPEPASSNLDRFIAEIHKATPNGEYILVQHHPNGDWSVSRKCEPVPCRHAPSVSPSEGHSHDRRSVRLLRARMGRGKRMGRA